MIYLSRHEHFCAAHKLYNPAWSKEKNVEIFGKCAHENWHGHNFELIVTVKGKINPNTGFFINVKELSAIIQQNIIEKLDHKNLNLDVPFLLGTIPTTENLAIGIWNELRKHLPAHVLLHAVKIYETPRICVEYYG